MREIRISLAGLFVAASAAVCYAQDFTVPDISGGRRVVRGWVDTGINLPSGGTLVQISASGEVDVGGGRRFRPEGSRTATFASTPTFPASTRYLYGLVARLTESPDNPEDELREDYAYGETRQFCARGGHLWLTVNDNQPNDNSGAFNVNIIVGASCDPDRLPTVTPDPRPIEGDIWVTGIEITQAIQTYPGNLIPLIGYKTTVVRVYVQSRDDARGPWTDVSARLSVRNLSGTHAGGVIRDRVLLPRTRDPRAAITASTAGSHRARMDDSLNFLLDIDQTAPGEREFQVQISSVSARPETDTSNNALILRKRFEDVPAAVVTGVVWANRTDPPAPAASWYDFEAHRRYTENVFPVPQFFIVPLPGMGIDPPPDSPFESLDTARGWAHRMLARMPPGTRMNLLDNWDTCPCGYADGMVSDEQNNRGDDIGLVMAQEVAHTLGLGWHTFPEGDPPRTPFPRADGSIGAQVGMMTTRGPYGFGIEVAPSSSPSRVVHDIMSYDDPPIWISPYTYCALINAMSGGRVVCPAGVDTAGTPDRKRTLDANHMTRQAVVQQRSLPELKLTVSRAQKDPRFLYVSGLINADGTATFEPFEMVDKADDVSNRDEGKTYLVALEAGDGQALSQHFFTPRTSHHKKGEPVRFSLIIPYNQATTRITLRRQGKVLAERIVSKNQPLIKLTPLRDAGANAEKQIISWEANDPDGDPMIFAVEYSSNSGQTWIPLSVGLTKTSFEVDFRNLPGSDQGLIRVVASDGVNTREARMEAFFKVPRKGPQVTLSVAKDEIVIDEGESSILRGNAFDWEDGPLTNVGAYSWSSDRDGALGLGPWIVLSKLTAGKHKITLTVYDSDKNAAAASTHVIVKNKQPLILNPQILNQKSR